MYEAIKYYEDDKTEIPGSRLPFYNRVDFKLILS